MGAAESTEGRGKSRKKSKAKTGPRESGAFFRHWKSFLCKLYFTKKIKKSLGILRLNEYIITVIKNDYKVHIKPRGKK